MAAEAIGTAASLLALTAFAFDVSKSVYDIVSSFKSNRVKDIEQDLSAVVTTLELIRNELAPASPNTDKFRSLEQPIRCCGEICEDMHSMLDECTKHSTDSRRSVRDWLRMEYKERSFDDLKKRLGSYKSTLEITFQLINLQDHSSTQDSLTELNHLICDAKEDVEAQLHQVSSSINRAGQQLQEVLRADQSRLQASLDALDRAQQAAESIQPAVVVVENKAGDYSRVIFGTDTSKPRFNLEVSRNEVGVGATAAAGVHQPETLRALLGEAKTADLALKLQLLQTQPQPNGTAYPSAFVQSLSVQGSQGQLPQGQPKALEEELIIDRSINLRKESEREFALG